MLQDFIVKKLFENFSFTPTNDQTNVLNSLADFISSNKDVFILKGYAGTGKTTLVKSVVTTLAELNIQSYLLAPTGRAAKVLSNYSQKPAFTIHKKIYRQKSSEGIQKFTLNFNPSSHAVFIVDEASMLSNSSTEQSVFGSGIVMDDLFSFVFNDKKCKLILIGDVAQLPPIGMITSPALEKEYIERTYLKDCVENTLFEVVRQSSLSGIIQNATNIRKKIHSKSIKYPKINQTADVLAISGADLLESLERSHGAVGIEETIIITKSNKLANRYNEGIRKTILWRENQISVGDYVMIVKNNYFWVQQLAKEGSTQTDIDFIANGDIAKIVAIKKYEDLYGFSFVNVTLQFADYNNIEIDTKLLLNTLETEAPALTKEQNQALYTEVLSDYADIKNKRTVYEKMKQNEYFNALQIKFAYAVTCHKAQGGQWKHVYIDHGYMPEETTTSDFLRWLYTAFTRASEKVYLVNFKKEFFE